MLREAGTLRFKDGVRKLKVLASECIVSAAILLHLLTRTLSADRCLSHFFMVASLSASIGSHFGWENNQGYPRHSPLRGIIRWQVAIAGVRVAFLNDTNLSKELTTY